MAKKFDTQKSTREGRLETVARRAQRSAKYAYAATFTKSGRAQQTVKASW